MDDGVNGTHRVRKAECKGMGSHLSDDGKGSKVLLGEFLGWASRVKYFVLMNTSSPTLKSGAGKCLASTDF